MSWLTTLWSAAAAACLTLAVIHLLVWTKDWRQREHLLFSLMALGATGCGMVELMLLHTTSVETYQRLIRWQHVPVCLLLISMVWLVQTHFRTGRRWLAQTISGLWLLALLVNFLSPHNLVFREITSLERVPTWFGESFTLARGEANPWVLLAHLAILLIIIFVADASWMLWRRGNRHRAWVVGGSILFFIVFAGVHSALVDTGVVRTPYMVGFAYLAIVAAMSFELGSEVVHATVLARELAQNQQRWQSLLQSVELAVLGLDAQGRVSYLNPFYERVTGFRAARMLGQPATEVFSPAETAELATRLGQSASVGPRPHSQWRLRCASGEERDFSWSTVRLADGEGKYAGLISVGEDVTDRMRAESELVRTRREMERLTRANLLGELASALAHELNQPLAAILSNAQAARRFLASGEPDPDELPAILDDIVRDDKRAGEVIHRLRAMLRKGPMIRERCQLNNVVREVLPIVNSECVTQNVTVRTELAKDLPEVQAGRVEIQQVLINLVMNALYAMRDTPPEDRLVTIQTVRDNGRIAVSVRDQGCGIPGDALPTIFDPFVTTRTAGLGMGLAICRRLVEAHGGWICAQNNPEGGAEFTFTLPAPAGDSEVSHG